MKHMGGSTYCAGALDGHRPSENTYIVPGDEGRQLLDLGGLVVVALPAQQHLRVDPLQGLGCLRQGEAGRHPVVQVLRVLGRDGLVIVPVLKVTDNNIRTYGVREVQEHVHIQQQAYYLANICCHVITKNVP